MITKGDVETWLREHPIGRVVESVTRSCPPVELVAPLVRAMVACVALLSHCFDGMQRAAAHRRSGKTRVGDGEQSTAVMCELHPSCTMGLRYDASALSGSGMYQKDGHTRITLWLLPPAPPPRGSQFVRLPGCAAVFAARVV